MTDTATRDTVRSELQSAFDNGQFEPGGCLWEPKTISGEDLTLDLVTFSPALESTRPDAVRPFVDEWLTENAEALRGFADVGG